MCVCICMCVCVCACMYVCMYVCTSVLMYVCMSTGTKTRCVGLTKKIPIAPKKTSPGGRLRNAQGPFHGPDPRSRPRPNPRPLVPCPTTEFFVQKRPPGQAPDPGAQMSDPHLPEFRSQTPRSGPRALGTQPPMSRSRRPRPRPPHEKIHPRKVSAFQISAPI